MSRIGKLPITVPSGVDVAIDGRTVTVKGPKGTLSHTVVEPISIERADDGTVQLKRPDDERRSKAMHGLSRSLVQNLVTGVTAGYEKKLEIVGVGYRVALRGANLEFALGFSHPVVGRAACRRHLRRRGPHAVLRVGHRQAAGRRDRREHPQDPQAGAVQGQGRAVRRRGRPAQGRKDG